MGTPEQINPNEVQVVGFIKPDEVEVIEQPNYQEESPQRNPVLDGIVGAYSGLSKTASLNDLGGQIVHNIYKTFDPEGAEKAKQFKEEQEAKAWYTPKTGTGQFVETFVKYAAPVNVAGKVGLIKTLGQSALAGVISDSVLWEEKEGHLGAENFTDDDQLFNYKDRLYNAGEGLVIGGSLHLAGKYGKPALEKASTKLAPKLKDLKERAKTQVKELTQKESEQLAKEFEVEIQNNYVDEVVVESKKFRNSDDVILDQLPPDLRDKAFNRAYADSNQDFMLEPLSSTKKNKSTADIDIDAKYKTIKEYINTKENYQGKLKDTANKLPKDIDFSSPEGRQLILRAAKDTENGSLVTGVARVQAKQYRETIAEVSKKLENDPANEELRDHILQLEIKAKQIDDDITAPERVIGQSLEAVKAYKREGFRLPTYGSSLQYEDLRNRTAQDIQKKIPKIKDITPENIEQELRKVIGDKRIKDLELTNDDLKILADRAGKRLSEVGEDKVAKKEFARKFANMVVRYRESMVVDQLIKLADHDRIDELIKNKKAKTIFAYYINNLLSGFAQTINVADGAANMIRDPFNKHFGLNNKLAEEGRHQVFGYFAAFTDSAKLAGRVFKTEQSIFHEHHPYLDDMEEIYGKLLKDLETPNPDGKFMINILNFLGAATRLPTRSMRAGDEWVHQMHYRALCYAQARQRAEAMLNLKSGKKVNELTEQLFKNEYYTAEGKPLNADLAYESKKLSYTNRNNGEFEDPTFITSFGDNLGKFLEKNIYVKLLAMPFRTIGFNVGQRTLESTPLTALTKRGSKALKGQTPRFINDPRTKAKARGEILGSLASSLITINVVNKLFGGEITGSYPVGQETNKPATSIGFKHLDGKMHWYDYSRWGVGASVLQGYVDLINTAEYAWESRSSADYWQNLGFRLVTTLTSNTSEKLYFSQVADIIELLTLDSKTGKWRVGDVTARLAGGFLPFSGAARAWGSGDVSKEAKTFFEKVQRTVPYLDPIDGRPLEPRRTNFFMDPVHSYHNLGLFREHITTTNPEDIELERLRSEGFNTGAMNLKREHKKDLELSKDGNKETITGINLIDIRDWKSANKPSIKEEWGRLINTVKDPETGLTLRETIRREIKTEEYLIALDEEKEGIWRNVFKKFKGIAKDIVINDTKFKTKDGETLLELEESYHQNRMGSFQRLNQQLSY